MKHTVKALLILCLAAALLLTGCSSESLERVMQQLGQLLYGAQSVHYSDMEYARPDLDEFRRKLDAAVTGAGEDTDADTLMEKVYGFYEAYYDFYTAYALANLHYCNNVTDLYWSKEYDFCLNAGSEVDAGMDQLLYALADSALREDLEATDFFGSGFFDDYQGDSIWDETFTDLMNEEYRLIGRYYDISAQAQDMDIYSKEYYNVYGTQLEALFVELVAARQRIADYLGYRSYPEFAYEFYYGRDYTPAQAARLMDGIRQELVPLFRELPYDVWDPLYTASSEEETFAYVETCAKALGGTAAEAFDLLKTYGLYDIGFGENKYNGSFEIFLLSYGEPFVFLNPDGSRQDCLTFAHEFGHFCSDYAAGCSNAGVDVAEVFSQGMEYLSLFYGEDTGDLTRMKMADCLCTFVGQAAYASFEQSVYGLKGSELTVENVEALFRRTALDYGMEDYEWEDWSYVTVPHFFTNPLYIISYVISNDAALQIYQAEAAESGAGWKLMEDNLATAETGFAAFTEAAGLDSPFLPGRAAAIRATLEEILE